MKNLFTKYGRNGLYIIKSDNGLECILTKNTFQIKDQIKADGFSFTRRLTGNELQKQVQSIFTGGDAVWTKDVDAATADELLALPICSMKKYMGEYFLENGPVVGLFQGACTNNDGRGYAYYDVVRIGENVWSVETVYPVEKQASLENLRGNDKRPFFA